MFWFRALVAIIVLLLSWLLALHAATGIFDGMPGFLGATAAVLNEMVFGAVGHLAFAMIFFFAGPMFAGIILVDAAKRRQKQAEKRVFGKKKVGDVAGPPARVADPVEESYWAEEAPAAVAVPSGVSANANDRADRANAEFLAASSFDGDFSRAKMTERFRSLHGQNAALSDALFEQAVALASEWQRRRTPHGAKVDPIAIVRKAREKGGDWSRDRSWLGGVPRLGTAAWPRGKDGKPLLFAAQISLSEIAAAYPDSPLPKDGALAFFIGEGAVIHVPGGMEPSVLPDDLPHAFAEAGYPMPDAPSHVTRRVFPYWPVEVIRLRLSDDVPAISAEEDNEEEIYAAQDAALHSVVAPRGYFYGMSSARKAGIEGADMLWWYGGDLVLRQLQDALGYVDAAVAMREKWIADAQSYQARLAAEAQPDQGKIDQSRKGEDDNRAAIPLIRQQGEGLAEFIQHFEGFVAGRNLWDEMNGDEIEVLNDVLREARQSFGNLTQYHVANSVDDLRNACVRWMMTAEEDAAVRAMPDELLSFINEKYRLPSQYRHQMFGLGVCIQNAVYEHLSDHLLLQLAPDDMPEMVFGDMGIWQFWISPEDLRAGRFDRVQLTFECA